MTMLKRLAALTPAFAAALGLAMFAFAAAGCDDDSDLENAAEDGADAIGDAGDDLSDAAEDTADDVGDALED